MSDPKQKLIPDDLTDDMISEKIKEIIEEKKRFARWLNETYGLNVRVDPESDEHKDTQ